MRRNRGLGLPRSDRGRLVATTPAPCRTGPARGSFFAGIHMSLEFGVADVSFPTHAFFREVTSVIGCNGLYAGASRCQQDHHSQCADTLCVHKVWVGVT